MRDAMKGDSQAPSGPAGSDHIWLRQSVTFAVNGQTRTLEMALPLRPGATPDEVEALLDEADAGMRRLSRRLDAHLAEVTGPAPASEPTSAPAAAPASATAPSRVAHDESAARPAQSERPAAGRPPAPATRPLSRPGPAAETPANPPATPAAAPATPAARAAQRPAASAAPASGVAAGGPDLSIAEFLSAAQALGLDSREAMRRLGVRSLNGLNLRESLDLLRRQLLREGGQGAVDDDGAADSTDVVDVADAAEGSPGDSAASASQATPATVSAGSGMPAPIGRPRFDEEDDDSDFELAYPEPGDLSDEYGEYGLEDEDLEETSAAPVSAAPAPFTPAPTSGPLSDVPGLDELLGHHTASSAAPVAAASGAKAASPPAGSAPVAADPLRARASEIIANLRAAQVGGTASQQQRKAFQNIVVDQLGETKANGLSRALWNMTPDRLGPEQLDAFNSWGKQDDFAEEAEVALTILREEYIARNRAQAQGSGAGDSASASAAPSAAPTGASEPRTRSATSRSAGGSRPASRGSRGDA